MIQWSKPDRSGVTVAQNIPGLSIEAGFVDWDKTASWSICFNGKKLAESSSHKSAKFLCEQIANWAVADVKESMRGDQRALLEVVAAEAKKYERDRITSRAEQMIGPPGRQESSTYAQGWADGIRDLLAYIEGRKS